MEMPAVLSLFRFTKHPQNKNKLYRNDNYAGMVKLKQNDPLMLFKLILSFKYLQICILSAEKRATATKILMGNKHKHQIS